MCVTRAVLEEKQHRSRVPGRALVKKPEGQGETSGTGGVGPVMKAVKHYSVCRKNNPKMS